MTLEAVLCKNFAALIELVEITAADYLIMATESRKAVHCNDFK